MLTLRCFGGVSIVDGDGGEICLRSRKHVALLVYLVAHPRTVHSREELAYLLWSDNDRRARHSLSQALYDIRSNLGSVATADTNTVRLAQGIITYEVDDFEQALTDRDHETALNLHRGEFAPDLLNLGAEGFDRWLDGERERCRVLAALALRNAQRAAEECGDWDQMCLAALRLIKLNPFDEEAHCALMRGLWMKGDPASALAHFRSLRDEDWLMSATQVVQLANRISQPATLHEAAALARPPGSLIGRKVEFRVLSRAFYDPIPTLRVVAVAGEDGLGKTTLVREFARFVVAAGGIVRWLFSWSRAPRDLFEEDDPSSLVVLDQAAVCSEAMARLRQAKRSSAGLVIVLVDDRASSGFASQQPDFDTVLQLDPLSRNACTTMLLRSVPACTVSQAKAAAELSGGHPALARVLTQAWVRARRQVTMDSEGVGQAAEFAINSSAQVRSMIDALLRPLSHAERGAACTLAELTPDGRRHATPILVAMSHERGLATLRERSWIESSGCRIELARPIFGHALRLRQSHVVLRQIHLDAARALANGNASERCAAAAELRAAGEHSRAHEVARLVAGHALDNGSSRIAGRAAEIAGTTAATLEHRFEAGLLRSEAELQGGRYHRALRLLQHLAVDAATADEIVRVQLNVGRVASRLRDSAIRAEAMTRLKRVGTAGGSPHLRRAVDLQLADLLSQEALVRGRRRGMPSSVVALQRLLASVDVTNDLCAGIWCDAFRTVFSCLANKVSRESAEALLETHADRLRSVGFEGRRLIKVTNFWVTMRTGRLQAALEVFGTAQQSSSAANIDWAETVALNNEGVALMELGRFGMAKDRFERCARLDQELGSPAHDNAFTLLNQAQCEFFSNDLPRCICHATELVQGPDGPGTYPLKAQGWALLGLGHLERRDGRAASEVAERLEDLVPSWDDRDDYYLVNWFSAATDGADPRSSAEQLLEGAEKTAAFDTLGAAKLRVLARAFSGKLADAPSCSDSEAFLRSAGASWFLRMSRSRNLSSPLGGRTP